MCQAMSARWPASPFNNQRTDAATELFSSDKGLSGVLYQAERFCDVQASVLSRWQRLHAFGRAVCNVVVTLGLLIWKFGFDYFRMGDAAAVSVVLFAIILAVTLVQLLLGRSKY